MPVRVTVMPPDAAQVAMVPVDAAVVVSRPDAAQVAIAPTTDAGAATPVVDKAKEASTLAKDGRDALSEGEAAKALDLFEQSLKLKKDKRTYVDRGRALHNLGRTDEAIASIDEAIAMSEGYLTAWEQKGLILWSAQKYDQARPVLEKYLELAPDGPRADQFRKMLDEPK
jgi:tetratricopeptide (TPR) repeat protein